MRFSVILPVYNVEKYLQLCVDSVLAQTFNDYELILVDDGSTDGSPQLCDKLAEQDARIRVIHKPNGGLSDARNAGTADAKGDYIIYIDSDDFVLSNTFLEQVADKAADFPDLIFYKFVKYFDSDGRKEPCRFSYVNAMQQPGYTEQIRALVEADAFYGMAWIKAIKRSLLVDNRIAFEVGLLGEDMEWNYHVVYHARSVSFVDEAFIAYRQREGSITSTHKLKNLTDFIYVLEKWANRIREDDSDTAWKHALYGSLAKYYSNLYVVYARLQDKNKKQYKKQIKALDWLWQYSLSHRPRTVAKIYGILGFNLTIMLLKILDRIK
ncbi:MAG: glycosyltransferase [Clostridia bacterium]|nr:glycosyltransferase [Clostridia bacterium]